MPFHVMAIVRLCFPNKQDAWVQEARGQSRNLSTNHHFDDLFGNLYFPYPQLCVLHVCTSWLVKGKHIHEDHCKSPLVLQATATVLGTQALHVRGLSKQRVTIVAGGIDLIIRMRQSAVGAGRSTSSI